MPRNRYATNPSSSGGSAEGFIDAAVAPHLTPHEVMKNVVPTVTGTASLVVRISPNRNSFHAPTNVSTTTVISAGRTSGRITWRSTSGVPTPSTRGLL